MAGDSSPRKPTEKEAFFFLTILGSMKNKPEVDWNLVAQQAGYANAVCAKTRFGQIKKQIGYNEGGSTPAASPATKGRAKQKAAGSGTNTTPSKVTKKLSTRTTPKKLKLAKNESDDDEDEEKFTPKKSGVANIPNQSYSDEDDDDMNDDAVQFSD